MPNIAEALKAEISRISKKALREELKPLQKASSRYRIQLANLRREIARLQRQLKSASGRQTRSASEENGKDARSTFRFSAKGLASHRQRLGLSAADFAQLVGVSALSVYKWESGKVRPRPAQLAKIASIRAMGKREAYAKLAEA